jgi:hypothetical protein
MYSQASGAYDGADGQPEMPALDLASQLQLGSGTPRGNNGPGPSSARSLRSSAKGVTPRGSQTARSAASSQAFGAVRLPRPPAQPKANRYAGAARTSRPMEARCGSDLRRCFRRPYTWGTRACNWLSRVPVSRAAVSVVSEFLCLAATNDMYVCGCVLSSQCEGAYRTVQPSLQAGDGPH